MAFGSKFDDFNDDHSPMADINVTPLVDVMLVLLIVFMITMPVITHTVPLNLPTTTDQERVFDPDTGKRPPTLSINQDGMYWGIDPAVPINATEVQEKFKTLVAENPDAMVALAFDEETTTYKELLTIMEMAEAANLRTLGIVVQNRRLGKMHEPMP